MKGTSKLLFRPDWRNVPSSRQELRCLLHREIPLVVFILIVSLSAVSAGSPEDSPLASCQRQAIGNPPSVLVDSANGPAPQLHHGAAPEFTGVLLADSRQLVALATDETPASLLDKTRQENSDSLTSGEIPLKTDRNELHRKSNHVKPCHEGSRLQNFQAVFRDYYRNTSRKYLIINILLMAMVTLSVVRLRRNRPWTRCMDVAVILLVCLALFAALAHHVRSFQIRGDFRGYYAGGTAIREGIPLDDKQAITSQLSGSPDKFPPLNYPPFWYIVMAPFTVLSLNSFYLLLTIGNYLALTLIFCIGAACLLRFRPPLPLLLALATLVIVSYPVRWTLYEGQVNLAISLLLVLFLCALSRGRPAMAGVMLGIAVAIKIIPVVMFIPLLCRREWRVLKWSTTIILASFLLSTVIVGPDYIYRYFSHGFFYTGTGLLTYDMKQSIVSVVARIPIHCHFVELAPWRYAGFAVSILLVVASIVVTLRSRKQVTDTDQATAIPQELLYSYWVLIMLLCSPHILFHHLAMLLPVLFVLTDELVRRRAYLAGAVTSFFWFLANHDYQLLHAYRPRPRISGILTANLYFWGLVGLTCVAAFILVSPQISDRLRNAARNAETDGASISGRAD